MTSLSSPENPVWADLTAKFAGSGLPLPPIPPALRDQLQVQQDWCWSTRPINGFDMYMFVDLHEERNFLFDILNDRVADYAAVSHAGHGITSWAINLHLVYGQLAVIMQVAWGGFERDNAKAAQTVAKHWARIAQLLATPPDQSMAAQRQRLVVLYSDFREPWGCSWVTRPGTYTLGNFADGFDRESTFDVAARRWSQPND